MSKILKVMFVVIVMLCFTGCDTSALNLGGEDSGTSYSCTFNVKSEDKASYNTFTYKVYVDGNEIGEFQNGGNLKKVVSLNEGIHKIKATIGVTTSEEINVNVSNGKTVFNYGCKKKDTISVSLYQK